MLRGGGCRNSPRRFPAFAPYDRAFGSRNVHSKWREIRGCVPTHRAPGPHPGFDGRREKRLRVRIPAARMPERRGHLHDNPGRVGQSARPGPSRPLPNPRPGGVPVAGVACRTLPRTCKGIETGGAEP